MIRLLNKYKNRNLVSVPIAGIVMSLLLIKSKVYKFVSWPIVSCVHETGIIAS